MLLLGAESFTCAAVHQPHGGDSVRRQPGGRHLERPADAHAAARETEEGRHSARGAARIQAAVGAILLAQTGVGTSYAALPLPALILLGVGLGLSVVVATSICQQGVDPRDAGTAGAMNSVSQQIGSAIGVAVISTFVATATTSYLTSHPVGGAAEATVHGFGVGYSWAAGVYVVAAVICGLLIRPKTYAHHHTAVELGDEAISMIG